MKIIPMVSDMSELIEKRPVVLVIVNDIIKRFEQHAYHRVVRAFQSAARLYIGVGEFGMNGHMYVKVSDLIHFLRSSVVESEGVVSYHSTVFRPDIQFVRLNNSDYVSVFTLSDALAWRLHGESFQLSIKPLEQLFFHTINLQSALDAERYHQQMSSITDLSSKPKG
ncbi:hypothetical protein [Vibrio parahaemolyticus]|uniref:Uncharacterized protein n=1 Tax=Vibrio parahaemolyticus TaxID=670 RepID=A0AAX1G123_VIBPH|nr:hypothetical protein [Vibrio parahaemolyticus]QLK49786.1 hypothetical protein DR996_32940 [Vibrio owensii]OUD67542.1 hypothetical protein BTN34_22205 [Vibrio parahaemolyticus]OUD68384.1 hypothetical protein BTN60_21225 [Vibrio parahaemolyticus]QHH13224.1 hypothetical protein EHC69_28620 [Vibrio parahaemolyticus]QNE59052.1 hypothetical protein H5404_24570 [Vibrio parahaemolyticus]